ncbi:hypothetical protein G3A43_08810 [Paraburkholderia aspalathi]|nr:hypothetical protein [Paraburkholderia aspalathi]MBK3780358.1 hypothetical protein [Paraburkholderia aspalathi]
MSVSQIKIRTAGFARAGLAVMYRVEADWRAGYDPFDDGGFHPATLEGLHAQEYPVVKVTPKGKWIEVYGERKFILNASHKRFACETVELALASFKARKKRQISILSNQLRRAQGELDRLEKYLGQVPNPTTQPESLEELS